MGKQSKKPEKPEDSLLGSSVQPATFELADGSTLSLGDVVRQAYEESDAESADAWNALDVEEREALIQGVVANLELKLSEPKRPAEDQAPDLTGLVKMHKEGKNIHAHPDTVKHHQCNGWKLV